MATYQKCTYILFFFWQMNRTFFFLHLDIKLLMFCFLKLDTSEMMTSNFLPQFQIYFTIVHCVYLSYIPDFMYLINADQNIFVWWGSTNDNNSFDKYYGTTYKFRQVIFGEVYCNWKIKERKIPFIVTIKYFRQKMLFMIVFLLLLYLILVSLYAYFLVLTFS